MPDGKLCYLDFGMVSYVEAPQRYSIIEAVVHMVNRDFRALAELYRRMGFIPADVDIQPIVVALEVRWVKYFAQLQCTTLPIFIHNCILIYIQHAECSTRCAQLGSW